MSDLIIAVVVALFLVIAVADIYPQLTVKKPYRAPGVKKKYKKVIVKRVEK